MSLKAVSITAAALVIAGIVAVPPFFSHIPTEEEFEAGHTPREVMQLMVSPEPVTWSSCVHVWMGGERLFFDSSVRFTNSCSREFPTTEWLISETVHQYIWPLMRTK